MSGARSELHSQTHKSHDGSDREQAAVCMYTTVHIKSVHIKSVHSTLWAADVNQKGPYCLPVNPSFGRNMQKRGSLTEWWWVKGEG